MKKLFFMALALFMVVTLCSCTQTGETTLRVWVGDNQDNQWINAVIANFKAAYPNNSYNIEVGVQTEGECLASC